MANPEFLNKGTSAGTSGNSSTSGWQELSDQAPKFRSEQATGKHLDIDALKADEEWRRKRDYGRYSEKDRRDVDRHRRIIEESDATKTEEQLLRDEINKAFELYFSQLPKLGFFNQDGQPPAEIIYSSEYDDYKRGIDDAAVIPIGRENEDGELDFERQLITFDLTTGLSKTDRLEGLIHGEKRGFTDFQYPSTDSGARLKPISGVPNFVIYLPMPQEHDQDQRTARYQKVLEGIRETGFPPEQFPNKSRLEEFFDSMRRSELPPLEIQDLFYYQIARLANIYHQRWQYEVKRLEPLGQNHPALKAAKRNRAQFSDIGAYFDERISGGDNKGRNARKKYLAARNPSVVEFFDNIRDYIFESRQDLSTNSYSASPDD